MSLPGDCARAATAEEARYRVNYPNSRPRNSLIVAMDGAAAEIARELESSPWNGARFLTLVGRTRSAEGLDTIPLDLDLRGSSGAAVRFSQVLPGADVVVMVASAGNERDEANVIGSACATRGITTTGIIVEADAGPAEVERTLRVLRPNSRMLVVASDAGYIAEMLTALRA